MKGQEMSRQSVKPISVRAHQGTPLPARAAANTRCPQASHARNPGMKLDLGFMESIRSVNRSALERRVASLTKRRSIKADNQAAWLLRAVACMD